MNDLTHLSLFTGIGGIDLAAEWVGFRTVGQVEQNLYANRILRSRFGRKIPRWTDIRDLSADDFKRRTGIDSPTLISGGFPCQPFSCAGKRRGTEDDRYLWPEMFRIVRELRPAWVLGENVARIVSMELESCCSDLEGEGYTVRAFLIPACGVGAWHRRERVFLVAHSECTRWGRIYTQGEWVQENTDLLREKGVNPDTRYMPRSTKQECEQNISKIVTPGSTGQLYSSDVAYSEGIRCKGGFQTKQWEIQNRIEWGEMGIESFRCCETLAISNRKRLEGKRINISEERRQDEGGSLGLCYRSGREQWEIEPTVGRVAHGVPYRVDRLRCLGNAVVPQQVYPIVAGIAQIESSLQE